MFTSLVDTPSKTKLAVFFLTAVPRSFHPEEVRKAVLEPGSFVATTLRLFVKNGFLKTLDRRGELYYRLNPRYQYIDELKGLLLKRNPGKVRDVVEQELARLNRANVVVLTGLFTGETGMPTDLLIVGSPSAPSLKKTIETIEKELRQSINYTVFTDDEFNERVNMYERFTRDLFDNAHIVLVDRRLKPNRGSTKKSLKKTVKSKK